jgi:hypothetical protein
MTKIIFGLLIACAMAALASPARAGDYPAECKTALTAMVKTPEGGAIKTSIATKFAGDPTKLCGCVADNVRKTTRTTPEADLAAIAAYLTASNALLAKGGSSADADNLANSPAYENSAPQFLFGIVSCTGPAE